MILNSFLILLSILPVENLKTAIKDTTILIIWTNPDDTTIDYVQAQMSVDTYPDTLGTAFARIDSVQSSDIDTVICEKKLIPGVRYYFSVFTVDTNANPISYTYDTTSSPSPRPPEIGIFYPDAYWTDKNIFKIVFNDTMDSIGVIHSIKVLSYHSSDTFYNYDATLIGRNSSRDRRNYRVTDTFKFAIKPYPRSLDTIMVHIQSDSARDIFGWKLDGNRDNVQQGSPDDDVIFAFYYAMLGDFNMDGVADIQDFNGYLRDAVLNNDTTCDIGPAQGNVPYLQKMPDGIINIEDIGVFIQMWTWSIQHFGAKIPQDNASANNVSYKFRGDTINILYNGKNFNACEILLKGNIKNFIKGNIFSPDAYIWIGKRDNLTVIDIVNPFPVCEGELLKVIGDKDTKIWIKAFNPDNQMVISGRIKTQSFVKKTALNRIDIDISGLKRYKIFDITGRLVLTSQTTGSSIAVPEELPPGIYFIKVVFPIESNPIKLVSLR